MRPKGSDIMFIGSFVLIVIVLSVPRHYLLMVTIPFIILELICAIYFIIQNKKLQDVKYGINN